MKVSLHWLNSYLDRPIDAAGAEQVLSSQGLPVEAREAVGDDECLNVEVTSNRSDCLSHVGIAREIAAGTGRELKPPDCTLPMERGPDASSLSSVSNDANDLCPVYTARVICGVKVGPSPDWLVKRLLAVGLRSINNVVDVTNFVLMELGQPLHAFDMNRLGGQRIVVRRARAGEQFAAIDGSKHKLTDQMLVIADASKPVAIAGVMGGLDSEVGPATTDILLESAMFAQLSVRSTSRRLKLGSDSSYRFERGVDPEGIERASRRAAQLIIEIAGGELCKGVIRIGLAPPSPRKVDLRVARCNQLLGFELTAQQQAGHLAALGLQPQIDSSAGAIECTVPTFRLDLHREVDLIEEVARLHGLSRVPTSRKIHIEARALQPHVAARRILGQVLVAHGYHETITFSFVKPDYGKPFLPTGQTPVMVEDERRKAEPMLRPDLIPSLMACRKANQDVGNANVRLYETASVWSRSNGNIVERRELALLADSGGEGAQQALRDLRGTVTELLERLSGRQPGFESLTAANYSHASAVQLAGRMVGALGVIDRKTQDLFDLQTPVVGATLQLDALIAPYPPQRTVGELPRFPGIERDVSAIVDEAVTWDQIEAATRATAPKLLESLQFVVTYRGKQIPKGRKSVTLRMVFRDPAGTLRHEQVDPQVNTVMGVLKEKLGAEIRT